MTQNVTGGASMWSKFADFSDVPDDFVLPPGDAMRGAKLYKKHCQQCHSIYPDGRVPYGGVAAFGPTLWNVCNRTAGSCKIGGQGGAYLNDSGIVWTDANLMRYMKNPRVFAERTVSMNFNGLADFQKRVDIVYYLHTLSPDHPNGKEIMNKVDRNADFPLTVYWRKMTGSDKK